MSQGERQGEIVANKTAVRREKVEREREGEHTPGPWHINEKIHGQVYVEVKGGFICDMQADEHHIEYDRVQLMADARLIASAPELLEALRDLLREYHQHIPENLTCANVRIVADAARQAIAKATGKD